MKFKKTILFAICFVLMLSVFSTVTPMIKAETLITGETYIIGYTNKYTYVRLAPYWTASVVDTMASGVTLKIFERDGDYIYVEWTNGGVTKRGYIPRADTDKTGYPWCNYPYFFPIKSSTTSTIPVRYGPSSSYGVIENIPADSGKVETKPLLLLKQKNNYYYVQYLANPADSGTTNPKFKRGWISPSSVVFNKPTAPSYLSSNTAAAYNVNFTKIKTSAGQCLTAVADSTQASGYKLSFASATNNDNQQWILHRTIGANNEVYYKIESYSSGLYIEVQNKIPVIGAQFILTAESSPNKAQEFSLDSLYSANETSYIRSRCSGDYLVAQNSNGTLVLNRASAAGTSLIVDVYETNSSHVVTPVVFIPHSDLTNTTISNLNQVISAWNNQIGSTKVSLSSSRHSTTGFISESCIGDSLNRIYMEKDDPNYLQLTIITKNLTNGVHIESDININTAYSWCDGAQPGKHDYASAFIHEVGHVLGLAHTDDADSVMVDSIASNTLRRTLKQYDITAIKLLYRYY